jgi:RecA-family ATPase
VIVDERPNLIVLDSFRSLWAGDENKSDEVAPTLDRLRNLIRAHDAATTCSTTRPRRASTIGAARVSARAPS